MKTGVNIVFGFYDVTAKKDGKLAISYQQPFSRPDQLAEPEELEVAKYALLERNQFCLDGSCLPLPKEPAGTDIGVWCSTLSDENGLFHTIPVLEVTFDEPHSSSGLTFRFYQPANDYCSDLQVTWYGGDGAVLLRQGFQPDNWNYFCQGKVFDYQKIRVEFYKTNLPYRFLKLTGLEYGEKITWGEAQLIAANMRESLDPVSAKISINTLNLQLHSDDPRFNFYNPQGVYELLQERQEMVVQRLLDGEPQEKSTFYLSNWEEANDAPASFEAYDLMGLLETVNFKGDLYEGKNAKELVAEIFAVAEVPFEMADSLANQTVTGHLPAGTCREALRNVAFCLGAVVDCSRGKTARLYPWQQAVQGTIPPDRQEMRHTIRQDLPVTGVEVIAHTYQKQKDESGGRRTAYQGQQPAGESEIILNQPWYDLHVSSEKPCTLLDKSANYVKIRLEEPSQVEVKGFPYEDNQETVKHQAGIISAGVKENIVTPEDCGLVNKDNAAALAERIYNYYQHRYTLRQPILLRQERVGRVYSLSNNQARRFQGFIEEADIDLTAGFLTEATLRGKLADNNREGGGQ